jgi:hypothetical protein
MSNHSIYSLINHNPNTDSVLLEDVGEVTVTDDTEHTTSRLIETYGPTARLFFKLQDGTMAELIHDGRCFVRFDSVSHEAVADLC